MTMETPTFEDVFRIEKCGFPNVIWVFRGCTPTKLVLFPGRIGTWKNHFGSNKKSPPKWPHFPLAAYFFLGKMILRLRKLSKLHPSVELTNRPWVWKPYMPGPVSKDLDSESILHPWGWDNSPDAGFYRHFWRSFGFLESQIPRNMKNITIQGVLTITPPKFNMAPEKWWLEDEFPFGIAYF